MQVKDYRVAGAQSLFKPRLVLPSGILPQGCRDRVPVDRRKIYTAATQHCHLNPEIFCSAPSVRIAHLTHAFHKAVLISWQMVKLKRWWLHLFLHFHLPSPLPSKLRAVCARHHISKAQLLNFLLFCESITVPQLLWHLITSINILIYDKQDSLLGQQMFRRIKGSLAWKECSVIKRHLLTIANLRKRRNPGSEEKIVCFVFKREVLEGLTF